MSNFHISDDAMALVEAALHNALDSDVTTLARASQHIMQAGGKRVRPRVVMLAYLAAGGEDLRGAAPLAAAIEMVHTATLVHDDINDHSLMRRGRVSVHAKYGRTFALLAGDYMFATVYEMLAPYGKAVNQEVSTACVRLVEGETLQALAAKNGELDRETYKTVIERKTASLFAAAARIGGLYAGAGDDVLEALTEYGHWLGMAFQIVDDILDIVGDPEALGKPVGLDVSQGRGVLVAEHHNNGHNGYPSAHAVAEAVVVHDDPVEKLRAKLRDETMLKMARLQAEEYGDRARRALERVHPSPAREEMYDWVEAVLARDS